MAVKEIGNENFEKSIESGVSVVDFFAVWCGPCKMMAPVLEELSNEMKNVLFYKVDVDKNMSLAEQYGVMGVPTIVMFKDGQVAGKTVGVVSKTELSDKLSALL